MSPRPSGSRPKILIVLIAGIGDTVLASAGIRAVRNGYPDADIHLLTSTEASSLAGNYPYVDRVHPFPIRELRRDKKYLFDIAGLIRELQRIRFDMVLNLYMVASLYGAVKMGLLFLALRAKTKIGHDDHGFGWFLTRKAPRDSFRKRHFADAMMDLARLAGGIPDNRGIEVFWDRRIEKKWGSLFGCGNAPEEGLKIALNPGGHRDNRRWPPEHYAEVADRIRARFPARLYLLGGPGEEGIARAVEGKMGHGACNLSGRLGLDDLTYLISRFDLLITNDSGPMHIAAAAGTPVVAIFGPEDPASLGPYAQEALYRVVCRDVPCRPCSKSTCEKPVCLTEVVPDDVLHACAELLDRAIVRNP
ncbi:MAG: glycosyltransferase family 9 protein [Thermodesulfobacteriota bacterium]